MNFLAALQAGPIGQIMTHHGVLVGAIFQFVHILGLVSLLTAVLIVAFRLLGWGLTQQSVQEVTQFARPFFWVGLIAAGTSGFVMFASNANTYASHPALQLKFALLLAALAVQLGWVRYLVRQPQPNGWARSGAVASLALWFSVGLAGRAIGFI